MGKISPAPRWSTRTDAKGTSGFTLSVNDTNTDILAEVDGTITAHGAPVGSPATIDPFTQVDWGGTNSIITLPAASGYSTGEEIEYDSGSGGAMPGLVSGSDYYIINVPGHPTQIQLASTYQNALNGVPIVFGSFPYLTAVIGDEAVNVPIVNIDSANTAIDFGYNPGFTSGQTVTYNAAPNQGVNGLTDGDTYTIAPLAGHSGEYQLLDTSNKVIPIAVDSTFGAIPYLTTTIDGVSVNLPITQVDDGLNAIVYASSIPGVSAGQSVVYHAAQGQAIAGLVDGTTYTMQETSTKGEYQLLDADNNPALIYADPAFTGLQQNLAATLDSTAHTVAFGFNTGFTNDSRLVYEGATDSNNANVAIAGLTVGQVYWVLPVTSDSTGESFQLSASQGGSPIALSASATSINFNFNPIVNIDADNNTVDVGFNIGLTSFAHSGAALTYQGALGFSYSGLQQGQTYYAIEDPNPYTPNILYLASTAADAATLYTAGQTSYNAAYCPSVARQ